MTVHYRAGLREACRRLSPIHPDPATLPIEEAFDWSSCLAGITFDRLYLVVFRSVRHATADLELLKEHDDRAYAEALEAGGLLYYHRGSMNQRRECLSFCLWESRGRAESAAGGASHSKAARIAAETYERYDLERYELTKEPTKGSGADGDVVFRRLGG